MSAPQSIINICSGVKLNSRYEHSIYFASAAAQREYFTGKVVKTFTGYTFLRKSYPIKVAATMEQAKKWNYLFFNNSESGKTYYYFINNVEYVNDGTVELTLELDVLQTYLFDFELLPSFVERQHTTTDVAGQHTVDEGLELGEFTNMQRSELDLGELCIMIMSTVNPEAQTENDVVKALPYMYNGVFSGVKIWAVEAADWAAWGNQLNKLDELGATESIVAMWMYPKKLVRLGGEDTWENGLVHVVERATTQEDGYLLNLSALARRGNLDGYTPKNKKLHTYPFHFLLATNNQGNSAVYRYERFDGLDDNGFTVSGALSPDGGVRLTPQGYNGVTYNYAEGLTLTGYPTCAWNSDVYKLWIAQNQNSQFMNMATGGLKIAGGIIGAIATAATGVGAAVGLGTAASGAIQIMDALSQKADKDIVPPQAQGNFSTSVNITNGMHTFSFYERCVNAERARIIDDYFTMYGYKLNRVQTPNINARPAFTYVKTIGCHIKGDMCNEDVCRIESIFDTGVTFWKNGDSIGNYSLNNSV